MALGYLTVNQMASDFKIGVIFVTFVLMALQR